MPSLHKLSAHALATCFRRHKAITLAALLLGTIAAAGGAYYWLQRDDAITSRNALSRLAVVKNNMYQTADKLDEQLYFQGRGPEKAYHQHIHTLHSFKKACAEASQIQNTLQQADTGQPVQDFAFETAAVCKDLAPLVDYSLSYYLPLEGFYSIKNRTSALHKFIPPAADHRLRNTLKAIESTKQTIAAVPVDQELDHGMAGAIQQNLEIDRPDKSDYQSLGELLFTVEERQRRILAAQTQYWRTYNGLQPLIKELDRQRGKYCDWYEQHRQSSSPECSISN